MKDSDSLSEDQQRKLREEVYKGMAIANSTSGHEPLPLLPEKTPEEQKRFNLKFVELFCK